MIFQLGMDLRHMAWRRVKAVWMVDGASTLTLKPAIARL